MNNLLIIRLAMRKFYRNVIADVEQIDLAEFECINDQFVAIEKGWA